MIDKDLLYYLNDLYRKSFNEKGEDKDIFYLRKKLEDNNWIINILSEEYSFGVNWLWKLTILNNDGTISDYSTGLYGDDGRYKYSQQALLDSLIVSYELYYLSTIKIDKFILNDRIKENFLIKDDNVSILEFIYSINKKINLINLNLLEHKKRSSKDFLEYINSSIKNITK